MDEKIINKIISVAYNDASWIDKLKIYFLANKNQEVKNLLEVYKANANLVHTIKLEKCPEVIVEKIFKISKSNNLKERSLFTDIYFFLFGRPLIVTAILTVFLIAIISSLIFNRPEVQQQYTQYEIKLAEIQTKQSLSIVAAIFNKTKKTVEQDVLIERVSKPIKQTFNLVNEFFIGENKNENIN